MRNLFIFLFFLAYPSVIFATTQSEALTILKQIDCLSMMKFVQLSDKVLCNHGGRIYQGNGISKITVPLSNAGNSPFITMPVNRWTGESMFSYEISGLQDTAWAMPTFDYVYTPFEYKNFPKDGVDYLTRIFQPGQVADILKSSEGTMLAFVTKPKNIKYDEPILLLTFTTKVFGTKEHSSGLIPNKDDISTLKTHIFYYGSWCGDGVLDGEYGEKYDDGENNGKSGFASIDCKSKLR